jgi:hypothetical protein
MKALVAGSLTCALVSDLTEALPAETTATTIDYITANWCPAITSDELVS